ncbi:peptidyl-tRNA hydrolase domain-containing protein 1 [Irineochytrium annulatum]|nr:peptidyl-tRNA hydrolase domain-containing protein 1 [Irineochytrium annulatum]
MADAAGTDDPSAAEPMSMATIFIVVRRDLLTALNWPVGSVIGQGAHAATAVIWQNREHPSVVAYMADIHNLRKVVFEAIYDLAKTKNEESLLKVEQAMTEAAIINHKWVELPEGIPTAIATIPYLRADVASCLKKCRLFK